jgi:CBS domain-containing protein
MVNRWASGAISGHGDIYKSLHAGLTVDLISTPATDLKTCTPHELISEVTGRNPEDFDFLPVVDDGRFVGMFHAAKHRDRRTLDTVWRSYSPLSEEYLIGANASILDFVLDADQRQCRLVISGSKIIGLVSLSDLQKLPVRAALFALITGFEITMAERIKKSFATDGAWLDLLANGRQKKIEAEKKKAKAEDNYVDSLLFTQFCDKREILKQQLAEEQRAGFHESLSRIEALRNSIAHANEYASSLNRAKAVCEIVRELLRLKDELQRI